MFLPLRHLCQSLKMSLLCAILCKCVYYLLIINVKEKPGKLKIQKVGYVAFVSCRKDMSGKKCCSFFSIILKVSSPCTCSKLKFSFCISHIFISVKMQQRSKNWIFSKTVVFFSIRFTVWKKATMLREVWFLSFDFPAVFFFFTYMCCFYTYACCNPHGK